MSKEKQGIRNGTGPYKNSYQKKSGFNFGKRQQKGERCPVLPKSVINKNK